MGGLSGGDFLVDSTREFTQSSRHRCEGEGMIDLSLRVLRTDVAGMPIDWIGYQDAARLYALKQVLYPMGGMLFTIHGGINAKNGRQSTLDVHSIVCTLGHSHTHLKRHPSYTPPLNNKTLFRRDAYLCLYCGKQFQPSELSRDHIQALSRGGADIWKNCVTACKRCNHHKGDLTPEEAGMELIAVPFVPSHAEYIYLSGRRILADQMEFLLAHFPRNSPLHERIEAPA